MTQFRVLTPYPQSTIHDTTELPVTHLEFPLVADVAYADLLGSLVGS